jgi:hypothetical protein
MKNKNPLTESFLVQLDVDLDGTGIRALDDRQKESARASFAMAVSIVILFLVYSPSLSYSLAKLLQRCSRMLSYL